MDIKKLTFYSVYVIFLVVFGSLFGRISAHILFVIIDGLDLSRGQALILGYIILIPLWIFLFIRVDRFVRVLRAKWFKEP